jgi:hypothetical protein
MNWNPSKKCLKNITIKEKEEETHKLHDAHEKHGKSSDTRAQVDASPTQILCGVWFCGSQIVC